jgi:hypothetical protein
LPDSRLNSKEYKEKYQIETVEVYSDIIDEDGVDNWHGLYKNNRNNFKTIRSCYSFTVDEMKEMWFMNITANYLFQHLYSAYQDMVTPPEFGKMCYKIIKELSGFNEILADIDDIFNPETPPRSIRQLQGRFRTYVIEDLLKENELFIKSEVMTICLLS